ncbi:MAG: pspE [Proteobacteria bacterium]|nr:pspE [Pseudomonadota bacterium]
MADFIAADHLQAALHDGAEIALLDIREHGEYGEAHLFFAVPLPYSRLEVDIERLVPRKNVRLVVYGSGNALALKAAARLAGLGYTQVSVLDGGVAAWEESGYVLFAGVNVPSKAFGELAEHAYATPRISAEELARWQARGDAPVVLDGRPLDEFAKMNIPGGICCPNGELAYRWRELVPDDNTLIVINCAGRTRSIIGAQTLINLGVKNPVYALENGTQGWMLADLALEHGSERRYPSHIQAESLVAAREAAKILADRFAVPSITAQNLQTWLQETDRTTYLLDIRTPEEFAASSLQGAQSAPGGQLIQSTDQYVGVRGARLVLFDSDGVRAPVVASWLHQMGWDAHVLADGLQSGFPLRSAENEGQKPAAALPLITAAALAEKQHAQSVRVVDLRSSAAFRESHIPGAIWSIRSKLADLLAGETRPVVLVADSPAIAALAASEFPGHVVWLLEDGFSAWQGLGLPVESSPDLPADSDRIDYLFFTHDRHEGNKAAARQYLAWEVGLLDQLNEQERSVFKPGLVHSSIYPDSKTGNKACLQTQ